MTGAASTAPIEESSYSAKDRPAASEIFPCLLDIAEAMMQCGADVHTVEQLLVRLGRAYGAARMNVLVITAEIIVTVSYSGNYELTFSRRVVGEGGTDFAKLEELSALCRDCLAQCLSVDELTQRLDAIKRMRAPRLPFYVGGAFSSGGFAVFFGGSILDGLVSALFALLVCFAIRRFKMFTPNTIVFNFATSLVVGILICLVGATQAVNVNVVIIGVIMLLIPGLAMTNATRDMLSGDTISGVMRFVESLLWATSLALGFMAAIWAASAVGIPFGEGGGTVSWSFWQMIPIVTIAALGFALFFNVKPRHILVATLGGVLTWALFSVVQSQLGGTFVPCVIASTFAAVYSEVFARGFRVPNAVFFIIAVIPLVPGRALYYTMYNAVNGDAATCASFATMTLLYAAGIAVGICLIAAIVQTWEIWSERHERAASVIVNAEKTVLHTSKRALGKVGIVRNAEDPKKGSMDPSQKPRD